MIKTIITGLVLLCLGALAFYMIMKAGYNEAEYEDFFKDLEDKKITNKGEKCIEIGLNK